MTMKLATVAKEKVEKIVICAMVQVGEHALSATVKAQLTEGTEMKLVPIAMVKKDLNVDIAKKDGVHVLAVMVLAKKDM